MICYPSTDQATPLIVVGPPRSGTRFITNVLNSIPGVTIQGEIPGGVMKSLKNIVSKCVKKSRLDDGGKARADKWESTKRDFMFAAWGNLTQSKRHESDSKCIYYGYKTPFHEKYFNFYNALFQPIRPKYICCVRCFNDHYFSVKARWPEKSIVFVSNRYVRSLRRIRYMKQQRPDDVFIFFLDDYKKMGFQYLRDRIFEPLGLDSLSAAIKKAERGPANSTAQLGLRKRKQLSVLENIFLKVLNQPIREFDGLHRDFG